MPGWMPKRRLAAAERAALEASFDDPSFDPDEVLATAGELMERAVACRRATVRRLHDRREEEYGPRVVSVEVMRVYSLLSPPQIDVRLVVRAPGSWDVSPARAVRWRLAATTSPAEPWRVVDDDLPPFTPDAAPR